MCVAAGSSRTTLQQLDADLRVFSCTAGRECLPVEGSMGTAGLNALAWMRLGAFRMMHSGARDGFGFLLIGLAAIGVVIWAVARSEGKATAKS